MEEQVIAATTQALNETMVDVGQLTETAYTLGLSYGPKLLLAIVTLFVGLAIINRIVDTAHKHLNTKADPTLGSFIGSLASVALKAMLLIAVASMIGVETTSFVAVLGAAGLAVGLALQGSLANFAGGVLILLFKPFKVGDTIEAQGHVATVREIQIFNTILKTPDNRTVIIPNGALSNSSLVNISMEEHRRLDMRFTVSLGEDVDKVKVLMQEAIEADTRVLKDPAYAVALLEMNEKGLIFGANLWVNRADYGPVLVGMNENVKRAFDRNGVTLASPKQDIHIHTTAGAQ